MYQNAHQCPDLHRCHLDHVQTEIVFPKAPGNDEKSPCIIKMPVLLLKWGILMRWKDDWAVRGTSTSGWQKQILERNNIKDWRPRLMNILLQNMSKEFSKYTKIFHISQLRETFSSRSYCWELKVLYFQVVKVATASQSAARGSRAHEDVISFHFSHLRILN